MMSAGRPRSASNRANASNGDVVITPPKSQITASIIQNPRRANAPACPAITAWRSTPAGSGGLLDPARRGRMCCWSDGGGQAPAKRPDGGVPKLLGKHPTDETKVPVLRQQKA